MSTTGLLKRGPWRLDGVGPDEPAPVRHQKGDHNVGWTRLRKKRARRRRGRK